MISLDYKKLILICKGGKKYEKEHLPIYTAIAIALTGGVLLFTNLWFVLLVPLFC